ncbi:MAG: hypothetical protein K2K41_05270 [Ruminiclostridium sp.]|nr:hypothetical protein [Ruminiclostridium sp.]
MKGLLYYSLLLNKKWFLGAGIIAAVSTAVCFFLYKNDEHNAIIELSFALLQAVVVFICTEWLGRCLEADIKCRFADYVLASGISKKGFVLTELMKNIISMMISYAMCIVVQLVMEIRDRGALMPDFLLGFILIVGVLRWITSLVTICLRSAEKAGLIVAIGFVLLTVIPYNVIVSIEPDALAYFEYYLQEYSLKWIIHLLFYIVIVGAYVVVYALFFRRVRKGDVCR